MPADDDVRLLRDLLRPAVRAWRLIVLSSLLVGVAALALSYLVRPTFTASTTFLPPQQQQSAAASALASLGSLASLAGGGGGLRTPSDQYVALMQSVTVSDRIIDRFELMKVYDTKLRVEARDKLRGNVRIAIGKKDGMISVEVDDDSPQRAADMANRHVEELRELTSRLAISEAQQRRAFFERQLNQTRVALTTAQQALQSSGFSQGALRAEPKAAAEGYARLKAEVTATEVRLAALRGGLTDDTPEVRAQQSALAALRAQLARLEQAGAAPAGGEADAGYVSRYRDFKYQEALFEVYARQFEVARVDESREGALIQVVDAATPPERKSKPRRSLVALIATLVGFVGSTGFALIRHFRRKAASRGGAEFAVPRTEPLSPA